MSSRKIAAYTAYLAGLGLCIVLIGYHGAFEIASVLSSAGWGLLGVAFFHLGPLFLFTLAWSLALERGVRPGLVNLLWIRWIGESVNSLLPVAQIGGDVLRGRLVAQKGVPGPMAAASIIADITAGLLTEMVFAFMGVALLLNKTASRGQSTGLIIGISIFSLILLVFYLGQRLGMFGVLARSVGRHLDLALVEGAVAMDEALNGVYRQHGSFLTSCGLRLCGWILGSGEVWLAFFFLGHPVSLLDAVMLESLGQAVRSAGFIVPGALGVQEGGFLLLGAMVGLEPGLSLTLSLVKRVRELLLGVPGLIVWQAVEGRRLWRGRRRLH
ncbi:MAG: flippase-like domain-containing protein [Planctomycetes bacterium]|nr:flippase-like domain-containing protein [Planctomycetota bacterium]